MLRTLTPDPDLALASSTTGRIKSKSKSKSKSKISSLQRSVVVQAADRYNPPKLRP
jgi:hypothetical protein